jgi:hypothetical protein
MIVQAGTALPSELLINATPNAFGAATSSNQNRAQRQKAARESLW